MSKFGVLIDVDIPVLLEFYSNASVSETDLNDVATALGNKAKVIKIDVDKNIELSEALRVKKTPTYIIYKNGEMKWRDSGAQDSKTLIAIIEEHL